MIIDILYNRALQSYPQKAGLAGGFHPRQIGDTLNSSFED